MPYRKKYRGKRRRRTRRFKRRRRGKSSGKKLLRDARTPGVNSAAELAVRIIATRQAKALLPSNLIFRREVWGSYNRITNAFPLGGGTPVDNGGLCCHLLQVPVWDIQTQAATQPVQDPAFTNPPVYNRGPNTLTANIDQDGYRSSNEIYVYNLSVALRFFLPATQQVLIPTAEHVTVRYAIVRVQHEDQAQLLWQVPIQDALPQKGMGYSSRLETDLAEHWAKQKIRTLKRGTFRMRYRQFIPNEKFIKCFWSGKLKYSYQALQTNPNLPMDQNGQSVTSAGGKIFLVMRSSVPIGSNPGEMPRVMGFIKAGYKNTG